MGKIKIKLHNDPTPIEISEYLKQVEAENIRNKLFKGEKVKALKARKKARRPVNGGSSNGTNS